MSGVKISELPAATVPLAGTELLAVVQGGVTKQASADAVSDTVLAEFAASDGSSLVGFLQSGTGAVTRTAQAKMRDVVSVKDFGAVGDGTTNDTTAIQNAINYAAGLGGGYVVFPTATYRITASLQLATGVDLMLDGSTIQQATNNTPVITAPSSADIQRWSVRDGILQFVTQQTSGQTSGVGILLANGRLSYDFMVWKVRVDKACDGIACPSTSGSFAFVGSFRQVVVTQYARWALNIDCDTATGGNTNLTFENCWGLQTAGSPIATSRGFRFRGCSMCNWQSLFADYAQGQFVFMESCTGEAGVWTAEACAFSSAASQLAIVALSNCNLTIQTLRFVACAFTVGANDMYILRPTTSGGNYITQVINWLAENNNYSGTLGNLYEVNPDAGVYVLNYFLKLDRTASLADFTAPYKILKWNNVDRTRYEFGNTVVWGTAAPTSGTWAVGDRLISTNVTGAAPVSEWVCASAGTPGAWLPTKWIISRGTTASRPTLAATAQGVQYLDTTLAANGKLITWTGTLWVDATGASV